MKTIIIGNVLTIFALIFTVFAGAVKQKRNMIIMDMGAAFFFTISDWVLKGYSGVVQNLVGVARNIVTLFKPNAKYVSWVLVGCGVVFGIYFNNHGFLGLLPVASSFWTSVCIINPKTDSLTLKHAFMLNSFSYAIYCFILLNFVGGFTDLFTAFSALFFYIKMKKEQA